MEAVAFEQPKTTKIWEEEKEVDWEEGWEADQQQRQHEGRVVELQRPEAARRRAGESLQAGAGGSAPGAQAARNPA